MADQSPYRKTLYNRNGDTSVYPYTIQSVVLDKDGKDSIDTYITEYNISEHQVNNTSGSSTGRRGTSYFILSEALAQVPAEYQHGGLHLTFYTNASTVMTYTLNSAAWTTDTAAWSHLYTDGGVINADGFVKNGGTHGQFLKADGTVDDTSYAISPKDSSSSYDGIYYETTSADGAITTYAKMGLKMDGKNYGRLKSVRVNNDNLFNYYYDGEYGCNRASAIVFGGNDTVGIMAVKPYEPRVIFFGGGISSTSTSPGWNIALKGKTGETYNLSRVFNIKTGNVNSSFTLADEISQSTINVTPQMDSSYRDLKLGYTTQYNLKRNQMSYDYYLGLESSTALNANFNITDIDWMYLHHLYIRNNKTTTSLSVNFTTSMSGMTIHRPSSLSISAGKSRVYTIVGIYDADIVITASEELT